MQIQFQIFNSIDKILVLKAFNILYNIFYLLFLLQSLQILLRPKSLEVPSETSLSSRSIKRRRRRDGVSLSRESRRVLGKREISGRGRHVRSTEDVGGSLQVFFQVLHVAGAAERSLHLFDCVEVLLVNLVGFLLLAVAVEDQMVVLKLGVSLF